MPLIKGTWFFEQQGYGWSESLWLDGTDTDLNSYLTKLSNYAQKRAKVSGANTYLTAARLSQEGVFRDAIFLSIAEPGIQGTVGQVSDAPDTAILFQFRNSTGGKRRHSFVRGVWDSRIDDGGKLIMNAAYAAVVNAWGAQIVQDSWGWLTRGSRVSQLVASANPVVGSGQVNVTLAADLFPLPLPTVTRVQISGVKGAYQINGSLLVIPLTQSTFLTKDRIAIFPYTAGGKVTWSVPTFQKIESVGPDRVVERRAGRPSYKSVGRRKGLVRA